MKIGISSGDPNGIGIEVILKTFEDNRVLDKITPIIYSSTKIVSFYKKMLNSNFHFQKINDANDAVKGKVNIINITQEEVKLNVGESTTIGGKFAFDSLEAATKDLGAGKLEGLLTAPINKKNIQSDIFNFPGHTEYLTSLSQEEESLMFMIGDGIRVGIVTNHIPLQDVAKNLTKEAIATKVKLMNQSLKRDFGIVRPRIAVLGLNPHAGENGMLGKEEGEIIAPAIEQMEREEILAFGPYAADGFFSSGQFAKFDGILAMYHDQGLIPFKALAGGTGVNFTAGLPIVRTSPDHGTAYEIAGKNEASPESFRNALFLLKDIVNCRKMVLKMNSDTLVVKKAR